MLPLILLSSLITLALLLHGTRSISAPATLFTFAWSLLILFAVLFGSPYAYTTRGLAIMSMLLLCFIAGCLLVSAVSPVAHVPRSTYESRYVPSIPRLAVLVGALLGAAGAVIVSASFGNSLLDIGSLSELLTASESNAVSIFRGESAIPFAGKLCFSALQLASLLSGARFVLSANQRHVWELASLAGAALLWSLVTTQRSYLLVPAIWWLSGLLAAYAYGGAQRRPLRFRSLALGAFGTLGFGAVVLVLRLVRTGSVETGSSSGLLESSRPWLAGYIPAFSSSVSGDASSDQPPSLSALLLGVRALLGQGSDELSGGYAYIGNGDFSNAATALRFFVLAGGLVGGGILLVLVGCASQVAYRRARAGSELGAVAYASIAAGILWSPNSWFYGYGGRLLVVIVAVGLVVLGRWMRSHASPEVDGATPAAAARAPAS